ncbi:YciE/YciF ferroxidase family protein [Marinimicrococcus flavescens]|uniref:Ferritin-like domain-containing protein n=1 Tax=Marinimicrococcus flavescens TaxID=3031815 RepID=A0AAP3XSG6_9PROT|nr:ferritin-like domain-containing protein [Marinimicrococcus flavescens]
MAVSTMQDLFVNELRDIYHAEKQLLKALPKMAKAASREDLRQAFQSHLEETRGHVERLEEVFDTLDLAKRGKTCEAMQGLVEEGREILEEVEDGAVRDAGLITAAQKVEHYEIASYGSLVALARQIGNEEVATILHRTLEEEKAADQKLTKLAQGGVNQAAAR